MMAGARQPGVPREPRASAQRVCQWQERVIGYLDESCVWKCRQMRQLPTMRNGRSRRARGLRGLA